MSVMDVSGGDLVGELASQLSTAKLTERCDECKKDGGTQHPPVTLWQACATVQDKLSKESLSLKIQITIVCPYWNISTI